MITIITFCDDDSVKNSSPPPPVQCLTFVGWLATLLEHLIADDWITLTCHDYYERGNHTLDENYEGGGLLDSLQANTHNMFWPHTLHFTQKRYYGRKTWTTLFRTAPPAPKTTRRVCSKSITRLQKPDGQFRMQCSSTGNGNMNYWLLPQLCNIPQHNMLYSVAPKTIIE